MNSRGAFFLLLILAGIRSFNCSAQELGEYANAGTSYYFENDVLARTHKGDKWYANGIRVVHLGDPNAFDVPAGVAKKLALFLCDYTFNCDPANNIGANLGIAGGQEIYTPADIQESRPQPFDRPWLDGCTLAAWRNLHPVTARLRPELRHNRPLSWISVLSARSHWPGRRKNSYTGSSIHNNHKDGTTRSAANWALC